ncbi:type IV secretion system protein [Ralstonia sp. 1138]|uniref:type IV secretion system protein n=1 Tax=Ralstonia sp. 1138 TaxID=3156423 RepID=UPI00339AFCF7
MELPTSTLLQTGLAAISTEGAGMASSLLTTGLAIFGALAGVRLLWMWLQYLLEDRDFDDLSQRLIWLAIRLGIVGMLLTTYLGGALSIKSVIVDGSSYLSQQMTGLSGDDIFSHGATQISAIIQKMDDSTIVTQGAAKPTPATPLDGGAATANAPQQGWLDSMKNWWDSKLSVFTSLISTGIGIGTKIVLAILLAIYTAVYMVGVVMMYIGIAFGPFFIPWAVLENVPVLSSLPEGWFKFTFSSAIFKVVAAAMLKMLGGTVTTLTDQVAYLNSTGSAAMGYDITAAIGVLIFALLIGLLLICVPSIANGLMTGSSGIALPRIRAPRR